MARYRADLIETAWGEEKIYGTRPTILNKGWGIVTAGITLPDPRYEWTPFYGIGVEGRNLLTHIQGRETLEGSVGSIMLCHDASRLIIGDSIGQIFNVNPKLTDSTTTTTATTVLLTGGTAAGLAVASAGDTPKYIVAISQAIGTAALPFTDTFAYIGAQVSTDLFTIHHTMNTTALVDIGWQGKTPTHAANNCQASVHSITRAVISSTALYENGSTSGSTVNNGVEAAADTVTSHVGIRETLKQNSFTLGSKIFTDSGKALVTNYMGNKVGTTTFNFAENSPVTFTVNFTGQDMVHNMSGGADDLIIKHLATGSIIHPAMEKVTEQPYFFSRADLKFGGTTFAKFRSFSISINNQLDPRYYINQSATTDNRQILSEILEGRRAISISGSLDMDDTKGAADAGDNASSQSSGAQDLPDVKFLQYLFNQGVNLNDPRDSVVSNMIGVSIEVELRRFSDASETDKDFDTITFKLPAIDALTGTNTGLILSAARMPIPAPPQVHQNLDVEGITSSMRIEIKDSIAS